jgi:hypothetical protein
MTRYVFKDAPITIRNAAKADPQKIGDALAMVSKAANGRLTPEAVVNAARSTKSPLHWHFEWDDKLAAQAHRLDQARTLIRLIRVEDEKTQDAVPAFVSVSDHGTSYRSIGEVTSSRELQLLVLRQAERDLKAFERRYHMLQDVCIAVRNAREGIAHKLGKLETRDAA